MMVPRVLTTVLTHAKALQGQLWLSRAQGHKGARGQGGKGASRIAGKRPPLALQPIRALEGSTRPTWILLGCLNHQQGFA